MRPVLLLARLSEADLAVDALKSRLAALADSLQEPAALRDARTRLAEAEAALDRARALQAEREAAQRRAAEKLIAAERRLYDGQRKAARELQDAEREVAQLRRLLGQADDALLEALIAAEEAAAAHAETSATVTRLTAEWEARRAGLLAEQARLTAQLTVAQEQRAVARRAVPPSLLPTYDALRGRRNGRALAALDGDTCSVCKVAASPSRVEAARYGDELVYCENCGRILWGE